MTKVRSVVAALSAVLAISLADAQENKTRLERDIIYGKGGGTDLKLDLAMPANGNGPFPVVVCIHGGAWQGGNRGRYLGVIQQLAARGYVAVTIQYRLAGVAKFPAQVEDCKCAVRWLRDNAEKYRIDRNRIGAMGESAGGHLSSMLGVTTKEDRLEGDGGYSGRSSRVQAVVNYFGPSDLTATDWEPRVQQILVNFMGGSADEKRDAYQKASPITYIRKGRTYPPFLHFHGTADNTVKYNQSVKFHEALKGIGAESRLVTMQGDAHGWPGEKMKKTMSESMAFFDQHLKKK